MVFFCKLTGAKKQSSMKNLLLLLVILCSTCFTIQAQKKSKGKDKDKKEDKVNFTPEVPIPVADTSKRFTGVIKYRMTSDDPADRDSVFIVFGETSIRVIMFIPAYMANQVFERSMIANFKDSTFLQLETKNKTYKTEKLSIRNEGTEFSLVPDKKTMQILNFTCPEYKGEMKTKDGEVSEAACLISNQHSFIAAMDYNFLGIQPIILGYKIVLGFRTKSAENENTYIMAYKIEPGNVDSYFDLSGYKAL